MSYYLTATSTSVTFHVTHVDGYDYYRLFLRPFDDDTNMLLNGLGVTMTEDFTFTKEGLDPNTKYAANVYYRVGADTTDAQKVMGTQSIITSSEGSSDRPDDWSWSTTIATGVTVPLSSLGYLAPVSAADWNALCARINEFRVYAGLSETTFTTVSSNQTITQAIVNKVLTAIGEIPGAGALPTTTNALSAAFYIQLATALNAVP